MNSKRDSTSGVEPAGAPKLRLNPRQQEAVDYAEGPLLVLAGPGTGKTQLLSARVERLLRDTDTAPETILCLTFTESGASNMRARLLSTIGPAARAVNIHTYHAFGSTILAAYQAYNPQPRRLDAAIDEVTQHQIIARLQRALPALDILRGDKVADIIASISSAKSARLTPAHLRQVAAANQRDGQQIASALAPLLDQIPPRAKFSVALPIYQQILEQLAAFASPSELAPRVEPIANLLIRSLNDTIDAEQSRDKPSVAPLTAWRNSYLERSADGGWRLRDYVANRKLESLAGLMEQYEAALAAEGLYDFADMIEMAIAALRDDRGFRLTMSERFQHILLDEFQDTNPSQFELIRLLCDYEQPDVMAVGDDDQAIYEFQGANASNLYDFQAHFGAKLVNLEENYRSFSEIVDTAKRVAAQIEGSFSRRSGVEKLLRAFRGSGEKEFLGGIRSYGEDAATSPATAGARSVPQKLLSLNSVSTVERHEFLSSDSEYYWVAEQIAALVASGLPQSEIAVIMPKHKNIAPLLPYLRAHPELKVAYEKRDNLFLDPALSQLLTMARYVGDLAAGRGTGARLLEILSYPFWEVPPLTVLGELHAARQQHAEPLVQLASCQDPKLAQAAEFLATLSARVAYTPMELMLDYLIGTAPLRLGKQEYRSPFLSYYSRASAQPAPDAVLQTFTLYENLATLRAAIVAHTHSENPRLGELLRFVDDYSEAGAPLASTSPYREASDAVQILTAHKSKGLEFRYVFLMSADSQAWGRAKGNNNLLSLPKNLTHIRHTGITDDERQRLLFVAMTRARDRLIITNSLRNFAGKSPDRLEYLCESEQQGADGETCVISPFLPEGQQRVQLHYAAGDAGPAPATDLPTLWSAAYLAPIPALRERLRADLAHYRLSATDLTTFIDLTYGGPMEFCRRRVLPAPPEPPTESIAYGNLVHATFEQITSAGLTDSEALAYYLAEAEKLPLEPDDRRVVAEKGPAALAVALREFGPILRSPGSLAELNLGPYRPTFAGVPLTGKLDHVEIDRDAKTITIYDFKTGHYHAENWLSHPTLYKYALQLSFYRCLLAGCPEYADYQVTGAQILFVTPDADGRVYAKPYDFALSPDFMARLLPAVYQHIISLDFLDDPALALEPSTTAGLRDIKEFVSKLTGE